MGNLKENDMNDNSLSPLSITIDMKKNRIRFFKSLLHELGDPSYVRLLVNPDKLVLAIIPSESENALFPSHKIVNSNSSKSNCVEIYSLSLVSKLAFLLPEVDHSCSYNLEGSLVDGNNIAIFSLNNLKKTPANNQIKVSNYETENR